MVNPGQIYISLVLSALGSNLLGVLIKLVFILLKFKNDTIFIITHCIIYGFFPNTIEIIPICLVFFCTSTKPSLDITKITFDLVLVLLFLGFFTNNFVNLLPVFLSLWVSFIICIQKTEILNKSGFYEKVVEENRVYSNRLEN